MSGSHVSCWLTGMRALAGNFNLNVVHTLTDHVVMMGRRLLHVSAFAFVGFL